MEENTSAAIPPQAALYDIAIGHYFSRALCLVTKLGIPDLLAGGPRAVAELARETETNAPALQRVLRLVASLGVFDEREPGTFGLTPTGECLRSGVPGSARAMVQLFAGDSIIESWGELEWVVRTGQPVFRKRGFKDAFEPMTQDPASAANFDEAMAGFTKLAALAVAAVYDFGALGTVVDVGGGNGALLIGILRAHAHLRGVVFDQPHVVERARREIAASSLAERCRVVGGSFFDTVPAGGDAYLLKHVIHDWNDEDALRILIRCRDAMGANGKLLVVENVYPSRIDPSRQSRGAAANDVNMLVNTGGRQRSEAEFKALFAAAGFTLTRIVPSPVVSVIEGVRAANGAER